MRPLRLELEGFTVYKKPQVIDFEKLSFFIIQGKTGAGKTSIVDAITYALYGKVPRYGSSRNTTSLVLSKGSKKLRVSLEFSVRGKKFKIERFFREKPKEDIVRVEESGKRLNLKKNQVESWVEKITGLDYRTFTKVILLPQGEFDRLLKPTSPKERREILINLLDLEIFEKIRQLASEACKEMEGEKKALEGEFEGLKSITEESIRKLEEQKLSVQEDIKKLSGTIGELEEKLKLSKKKEELLRERESLSEEIKALEDRSADIQEKKKKLELAKKIAPFIPFLERSERLAEELRELRLLREKLIKDSLKLKGELENVKEELQKIEEEYSELPQMREELNKLNLKKEKLLMANEELDKISILEEDILSLRKTLEDKEAKLSECEERLLKGEKLLEEVKAELQSIDFDEDGYERLIRQNEKRKKLLEEEKKLKALSNKKRELEKSLRTKKEELKELRRRIQDKEALLKEEQLKFYAHHVAKHLKEGDECPVCGGIFKGKAPYPEFTKLDKLEKEIESMKDKLFNLEKEISSIEASLSLVSSEEEQLRSKLEPWEELLRTNPEEKLRSMEKLKQRSKELQEKLQKYSERYNSLLKEKEKALLESERLKAEISSKEEQLSLAKVKVEELAGKLISQEELKKELQALETHRKDLEEYIGGLERKRERVKSYAEELERKLVAVKTKVGETEALIRRKEEEKREVNIRLAPLYEEVGDLERIRSCVLSREEISVLEEEIENYSGQLRLLRKRMDDMEKELIELGDIPPSEDLEKEYVRLKSLYDERLRSEGELEATISRAKEQLNRKEQVRTRLEELDKSLSVYRRISEDLRSDRLQDFIASLMLKRVVERASDYLYDFTRTYHLDMDPSGELIVVDHSQGEERSVKTLSGGETFLASLSLALGISDILSSQAHLESLFIDEGFGSLDEETRERVSDILQLVKQRINRMVGIISHIPDLAERFHQRIVVKKHGDFSTVEVIT